MDISFLNLLFVSKFVELKNSKKTDRRNISAIWNNYIKKYDIKIILNYYGKSVTSTEATLNNLIDLVNKGEVDNSYLIKNPDREGQYLLISRIQAFKIMTLGMI